MGSVNEWFFPDTFVLLGPRFTMNYVDIFFFVNLIGNFTVVQQPGNEIQLLIVITGCSLENIDTTTIRKRIEEMRNKAPNI
jgi:hypothetical protein